MTTPYAATRLDALRQLRREGYAVVRQESLTEAQRRPESVIEAVITDPRCSHTFPLPGWMSPDQEDPCRCDLLAGHEGAHSCKHLRESGQQTTVNSAKPGRSDG